MQSCTTKTTTNNPVMIFMLNTVDVKKGYLFSYLDLGIPTSRMKQIISNYTRHSDHHEEKGGHGSYDAITQYTDILWNAFKVRMVHEVPRSPEMNTLDLVI